MANNFKTLEWQSIPTSNDYETLLRTPIFGGWLVKSYQADMPASITFVPDKHWEWDLKEKYNDGKGA